MPHKALCSNGLEAPRWQRVRGAFDAACRLTAVVHGRIDNSK
jgi:hypothetical protein